LFSMNFREYLKFCKKDKVLDKIKGEVIEQIHNTEPEELKEYYDETIPYKGEIAILFNEYLLKGGYPDVINNPNIEIWQDMLQNVIKRTIYDDIAAAYKVRKPRRIEDLLTFIALNTSQTFSYTSISKYIEEKVDLVMNYIEYLKSAYLIEELMIYAKSSRQIRQPKKFFLLDIGVRNAIFKENDETLHEQGRVGLIVETVVQTNIVSNYRGRYNIYYWKNKGEVDVILDLKTKLIPIEIKYKNNPMREDFKGLIGFMNKFSVDTGIVVTKDTFQYKNYNDKTIIFIPAYLFLMLL